MSVTTGMAILNFTKTLIPYLWNDKDETKFNPNAVVRVVLAGVLIYLSGPEMTSLIIEMAKEIE